MRFSDTYICSEEIYGMKGPERLHTKKWPAGVTVCDDLAGLDLSRALAEVSPERRAYALGYRLERDRRLSVAVYLLLKEALGRGYGLVGNPRLGRGRNGKPFLQDHPEIHFNLSHCPRAAVCAVADNPVGIDVEEVAPVDWEVARRVLSEEEQNAVRTSSEPDVAFARYWTQKEAFAKLTGDGIDDSRLPALLAEAQDVAFETVVNRRRGYVLTVATVRRSVRPVLVYDGRLSPAVAEENYFTSIVSATELFGIG